MPLLRCKNLTSHPVYKAVQMMLNTMYLVTAYFSQDQWPPFLATVGVVVFVIIHDLAIFVALSYLASVQLFCMWESVQLILIGSFLVYYGLEGFKRSPETTAEMVNKTKEDDKLRVNNASLTVDLLICCVILQVVMVIFVTNVCVKYKRARREEAEEEVEEAQIVLPFNHVGVFPGHEPQQQPVEFIEMVEVIEPNEE